MQSSRCILPADSVACQENYAVLRHLELMPVILSAAKDLASLPKRSKARAQDDRPDPSQARSREAFSPNAYPISCKVDNSPQCNFF